MQVFWIKNEKDLSDLKNNVFFASSGCALALGFFDGVHIAHRELIRRAKRDAERNSLPLVIFTFSASNSSFKPKQPRLFTDSEKLQELNDLGADVTLVFDFDFIKNLSKEQFVDEILVAKLNTHLAFCGFNFKFGKNASGNTDTLRRRLALYDRSLIILEERKLGATQISSSLIRKLLSDKNLEYAAKLLGKPFFIDGTVSHGLGLGKKLGIPTVNLDISNEKFTLPTGVYYTVTEISGKLYSSITNLGNCPTFDERETHIETHILNFDGNIYDRDIRIYFVSHLRDEIKFSSKEELIMQINIDKKRALALKKEIKWQEIGLNLQ